MEIKGGLFQVFTTTPQECQDLCFGEIFYRNEVFILVVQFLLKNAKVLEKMVVTKPLVMQNQTRKVLCEFLQVAQKLLSFPRSSPRAVVMFPYQ